MKQKLKNGTNTLALRPEFIYDGIQQKNDFKTFWISTTEFHFMSPSIGRILDVIFCLKQWSADLGEFGFFFINAQTIDMRFYTTHMALEFLLILQIECKFLQNSKFFVLLHIWFFFFRLLFSFDIISRDKNSFRCKSAKMVR